VSVANLDYVYVCVSLLIKLLNLHLKGTCL